MKDIIYREDAVGAINGWLKLNHFPEFGDGMLHLVPSADRWIPCTERLPEERQDVYVTVFWDNYGDTVTAYGRRTQFGWSLWNTVEGELLKGYTVTAWMPLPEPWKGADYDSDNI